MKPINHSRRPASSSDPESEQPSFQSASMQQGPLLTSKNQRSKRNNVVTRNYQQDFSEQLPDHNSDSGQYIYFKGGRVSKILAQRPIQGTDNTEKLCKFYSKSYLHVQWLTPELCHKKNIQMLRQTKRSVATSLRQLQQTQEKYGHQHFFPPSYTKVDRILTTAVLFPIMHHKKGSEMNGKWSQMMMLVCSKILNFEKDNVAYGVIEKDDYHPQYMQEMKIQNKVKIEHIINRVYLDRYHTPEEFWKDVGQSIKTLEKAFKQSGRDHDVEILKQCVIFLYWQWFCLSRQRFLTFLPKSQIYQKIRFDLENQKYLTNFKLESSPKFDFESLIKQNIFTRENYGEIPSGEQELLLLHPGRFSYNWLVDYQSNMDEGTDYTETIFKQLDVEDFKKLDLNVEIDTLYLVKWCDLDYDEVTWEKESQLNCKQKIQNFKQYSKIPPKKDRERIEENKKYHKAILNNLMDERGRNKQPPEVIQKCKRKLYHLTQTTKEIKQYGGEDIPVYKGYKILKNFQLQGLNWLIKCWHQKRNCILADQMGLGKTIQTIAFLNHLHVFENVLGPFLIVAPVSTLKQWRNQIQQWSDLNCVLYKGKAQARDLIEQYQFYHKFVTNEGIFVKFQKLPRFQVLLTNYEIFVSDIEMFQKLAFQHIIMDEAHKMKNSKSKIALTLKKLPCPRILLLTGTPIQNNTSEIYGLLNIIEPKKFNSLEAFKSKFGSLKTSEQLNQLKQILKPYLLRRVKSDVEKSIPKLSEMLVNLDLTKIQKAYYRGILQKNKNKLLTSLNSTAINNITMCLRQCCNHPYMLCPEAEDEITSTCQTDEQRFQKFITASSKLIFVHKFLSKCKEKRTKTLIFTQFLEMIRLLREYCSNQQILFETLDGGVNYEQRQNRIDRFNTNPDVLVFIISTKAGGIGINLTSATNIIIYDSDWNPQNDIQAIARAHRIGQHKNVTVYRLITTQTYEDILYKAAVKKLGIGLAILDNQYFNNHNDTKDTRKEKSKQEIQKLLRDGVIGFLKGQQNTKDEKNSIQNQSIEDIITKSCTTVDYQTKDCSFTSTKFEYEAQKDKNLSVNDPNFWEVALENVQSPLQKLVKKLKNEQEAKKIFEDVQEQLKLMMEANEVVYNFIKSKVSMSHFNAQDQRELRSFLQKITYSRQFLKQYKNIANDWLEEIEKPSRRFEKCDVNVLMQISKNKNNGQRIVRSRSKKNENQQNEEFQEVKQPKTKLTTRRSRVIDSSDEKSDIEEKKKEISEEDEPVAKGKKLTRNSMKYKNEQDASDEDEVIEDELEKKSKHVKIMPKDPEQVKKFISENLQYYLEKICSYCERKVCSKICKGRCKRSFHQICYNRYKQRQRDTPTTSEIQQLKLSKQQLCESLSDQFECFQCKLGEATCFICGIPGEVIGSAWHQRAPKKPIRLSNIPNSRNQIEVLYQQASEQQKQAVFQCRMQYCNKAYHMKCLKQTKKQLEFELYCNKEQGSYPLKCPAHFCSFCHKRLTVNKCSCLRCPVSYHMKCKSPKMASIYEVDHQWFICRIHMGEDELQRRNDEKTAGPKSSKREKIESKKMEKEVSQYKDRMIKEDGKEEEGRKQSTILNGVAEKMEKALKNVENGLEKMRNQ